MRVVYEGYGVMRVMRIINRTTTHIPHLRPGRQGQSLWRASRRRGRRVDGPPHNTTPMREMRREGKGRGEMKGEEI